MSKGVLLLDGGMGQELIRRSSSPSAHHLWSLKVMLDEPELISEVHRDFCLAGASIACLNTYAITRARLARSENLPSLEDLLGRAYKLAEKGVRSSSCNEVALISTLPPLVASYRADTQLPMDLMVEEYAELIDIQSRNADGFIAETIPSINEAIAVLTAANKLNVQIVLGLTVSDENGEFLRSGEPLSDTLTAVKPMNPLAVVVNCSKPEAVSEAMPILSQAGLVFGAYANGFTAIDALEPGGVVDVLEAREDLNPKQYAEFADKWLNAGATIIGGCCEVGPDHISALDELITNRGLEKLKWESLSSLSH